MFQTIYRILGNFSNFLTLTLVLKQIQNINPVFLCQSSRPAVTPPASGPAITVSEHHSVISSTASKVMDTLDLVASEVRQTKHSLMLSTTKAIKR